MKNILIFILGFIFSCNPDIKSTSDKQIVNSEADIYQIQKKNKKKNIIDFFSNFQNNMKKADKEKIAFLTHFPLNGDCIYYFIYGEKINNPDFDLSNYPIDEKKFIENFDKIFDENAKYLLNNVDIKRLIEDENYSFKKVVSENSYYTINFYQKDYFCNLSISYIDSLESTSEHSTIYQFKILDDSLVLHSIHCAG